MGSKSSKHAQLKQLKSVLSAVPQFIPTHAVDVGLLDAENNLVSGEMFDSVHKETVSAMMRSINSFASTLSSERSEETEAVHLVGKDHICLLFPLKHRDGEKFDSPECLDDDEDDDAELGLQRAYDKLLGESYKDLIGVVENCAHLLDPSLLETKTVTKSEREKE